MESFFDDVLGLILIDDEGYVWIRIEFDGGEEWRVIGHLKTW